MSECRESIEWFVFVHKLVPYTYNVFIISCSVTAANHLHKTTCVFPVYFQTIMDMLTLCLRKRIIGPNCEIENQQCDNRTNTETFFIYHKLIMEYEKMESENF